MTLQDPHVAGRCAEIEALLQDASLWACNDAKLGANLAAYISVMIMGVLEESVEHLVAQRVRKTQDPEVESYVVEAIGRGFRNPDYGSISGLLKQFSPQYQQLFSQLVPSNGKECSALESIMVNKNALAHTGTWKFEMSLADVEKYFRRILPILEALEQILA